MKNYTLKNYKYYYTYEIRNIVNNMYYIGRRHSSIVPNLDLGKRYFSSSSNKEFIRDQKINPQDYIYIVLNVFDNKLDMIKDEILLHQTKNVKDDVLSYNVVNATAEYFDFTHCKMPDSAKKRIGDLHRGRKHTDEFKANISKRFLGKPKSEETKIRMSKATKGIPQNEKIKAMLLQNSRKNSELMKQGFYKVCRIIDKKEMNIGTFTQWCNAQDSFEYMISRISDRKLMTTAQFNHWKNNKTQKTSTDLISRIDDKKILTVGQFIVWYTHSPKVDRIFKDLYFPRSKKPNKEKSYV